MKDYPDKMTSRAGPPHKNRWILDAGNSGSLWYWEKMLRRAIGNERKRTHRSA